MNATPRRLNYSVFPRADLAFTERLQAAHSNIRYQVKGPKRRSAEIGTPPWGFDRCQVPAGGLFSLGFETCLCIGSRLQYPLTVPLLRFMIKHKWDSTLNGPGGPPQFVLSPSFLRVLLSSRITTACDVESPTLSIFISCAQRCCCPSIVS